jgi:hypothetical protein
MDKIGHYDGTTLIIRFATLIGPFQSSLALPATRTMVVAFVDDYLCMYIHLIAWGRCNTNCSRNIFYLKEIVMRNYPISEGQNSVEPRKNRVFVSKLFWNSIGGNHMLSYLYQLQTDFLPLTWDKILSKYAHDVDSACEMNFVYNL